MFRKRAIAKKEIGKAFHKLSCFWSANLFLYWGVFALLGSCLSLFFHFEFLLFIIPFCLIRIQSSYRLAGVLIFLLFFAYAKGHKLPQIEKSYGSGRFQIHSVKTHVSTFQKNSSYIGKFSELKTDKGAYSNVPCSLKAKKGQKLPPANRDYFVSGTIDRGLRGGYIFTLDKGQYFAVDSSFSFAKLRFDFKKALEKHIHVHIKDTESASLLGALVTGNLENPQLKFFFQKLGLQHILAISGFHFALLASFLNVLLKRLLPKRTLIWILLFLTTLYCFFIGPLASVLRAWIAITFYLISLLIKKEVSAFNLIGLAMILEILYDPRIPSNLGFQLTFLATFGILVFYKVFETLLKRVMLERTLSVIKAMSFTDKLIYLFHTFLRKALALNFAVLLFTLPVILFLFQRFPIGSVVYNLFFPPLIAICFFLLLFTLLWTWVPLLSLAFGTITSSFTKGVIYLTYYMPSAFGTFLYVDTFPLILLISVMTPLFFLSQILYESRYNHFLISEN